MATDFVKICRRFTKKGCEIYPEFIVKPRITDLMIQGKRFYAVWDEEHNVWCTDESRVAELIDKLIDDEVEKASKEGIECKPLYLRHYSTNRWREWLNYASSLPDNFHKLDHKIIFADSEIGKKDYASKKLSYTLMPADTPAYDQIMETLYFPEERQKLEWAIGSIIAGDSVKLQKFIVLYGEGGTGKGTVLNIIKKLFDGYWAPFNAKELVGSNNGFALEQFKTNPLVAIDSDSDLSRIEDNTLLNAIISHETLSINEKFKAKYKAKFDSFIFCGSNSPVKITNTKSGLIRRLIDVYPSGNKIDGRSYNRLVNQIDFELGGIACKCLETYKELGFHYYDSYIAKEMISETNDFFNFVEDSILVFTSEDYITLRQAWAMYQEYCKDANVPYPMSRRIFKTELKGYFDTFEEDYYTEDRKHLTSVYTGFRASKFDSKIVDIPKSVSKPTEAPRASERHFWLDLSLGSSILDIRLANCPAQYDSGHGCPKYKWSNVTTTLDDIRPTRLHYIKPPLNHIVIDFDLTDENGNKSLERNIEAASSFPPTYAEVSKSGQGLHLHYIYDGDPEELAMIYAPNIEIKVFRGNSSLRRKLSLCNDLDISHISSGLPHREEKKIVVSDIVLHGERSIRTLIKKHLRKEIVPSTRQSIDLIDSILNKAYDSGMNYDISDLQPLVLQFATTSSHQSQYCVTKVANMKFKSENERDDETNGSNEQPIAFYDVEIFPNLFLLCYKFAGDDKVTRCYNPNGAEIEQLIHSYRLIGFNNRKYDNHILYGRILGYSLTALYDLSQKLIKNAKDATFLEAYNISYADVYDFCSEKQSLKKWEIDLGIHHHENAYPWDEPLDESKWEEVGDYCCDDVRATEAVFNARQEDFVARTILSAWSDLSINSSTRMHATKIIFGNEKHPKLNYVDLSTMFPGYKYEGGISTYQGEVTGEGGYVYAEPGIYFNVALLDIASMHPHSILAMNMFGDYTVKFKNLVDCRIHIKKHEYEAAKEMLPESVHGYLTDEYAKALSFALKIVINSIYGYTKAHFDNPFKDPRNVDNIVAKRGALFMINLKREVQRRGYTVAHIKTDSIKIPNATPEIIQFITDYGESYGYFFEHEATYERMCLVNDAVYVARYSDGTWTATGTQFQVPYVFKTLFSKEPITFADMCETKSVTSALYLDFDENLNEDEHNYKFVGRIGLFCPVKAGCGGGRLLRQADDNKGGVKYDNVSGAKGYRWLESETMDPEKDISKIDITYYDTLLQKAVAAINAYENGDQFII